MCQKTKVFVLTKTSGFPDAAAADAAADGRTLRSQPDPSPNAPRDQIHRKGPCCDIEFLIAWDIQSIGGGMGAPLQPLLLSTTVKTYANKKLAVTNWVDLTLDAGHTESKSIQKR